MPSSIGRRVWLLALALLLAACAPQAPRSATGPSSGGSAAASGPAAGRTAPAGGPASAAAPAPAGTPGRFTIRLVTPLTNYNPYSQSGTEINIAWQGVFEGLARRSAVERAYEPLVAERWEVLNPTTWRFHIRPGIRFSDGSPLTAADVRHSLIDRALNDPDSNRRSGITTVEDAVVVDDLTLDATTKVPDAALLATITTAPITSKALYDRVGKEAADRQPVSAGPYTLHELVPDQRMVLQKNPYYWRDISAAPDEVVIRWIKEPVVGLTALLSGEVDMSGALPPNLLPQLTGSVRPVALPSGVIYFMGIAPIGPLANKMVRQAINYAVDKDAIVDGILKGQATRVDGALLEASTGYTPDLTLKYRYDPARARDLLAQAGYPGGFQTELVHPIGRYTGDVDMANVIAAQLGQVGIQVTLKPTETSSYLAQTRSGTFPLFLYGSGDVDEPNRYLLQFFRSGATRLLGGWQSAEVDRLLDAETAEFDTAKRAALLGQLQSALNEEAPLVPLLTFTTTVGLSNRWSWDNRYGSSIYWDTFSRR
ncbi:MAG TPA: ABC transporter substrate-binding protein [Chloroflexota bacterium]|jgi:peptide/nickel transport system substrate-binding protein